MTAVMRFRKIMVQLSITVAPFWSEGTNLCRSILAFAPEPKWIMQIVYCCYAMIGWTVTALSPVIGRL